MVIDIWKYLKPKKEEEKKLGIQPSGGGGIAGAFFNYKAPKEEIDLSKYIIPKGQVKAGAGVKAEGGIKLETKKEELNIFDTLNDSIEKNYKQYQNLTKKLETYKAEYDYSPDIIKPSLAANFNKLANQHNDLVKQLQIDIAKRDQIITTTNKANFIKYKQLTGLPGEVGKATPLPGPKPIIEGLPISKPEENPNIPKNLLELTKPEPEGLYTPFEILLGSWEVQKKANPELQKIEDLIKELPKISGRIGMPGLNYTQEQAQIAYIYERLKGIPTEKTIKDMQSNLQKYGSINPPKESWKDYYKREGLLKTILFGPDTKYGAAERLRNINFMTEAESIGWKGLALLTGAQIIDVLFNTPLKIADRTIGAKEVKEVMARADEAFVPETGNFKSTLSDNDLRVMQEIRAKGLENLKMVSPTGENLATGEVYEPTIGGFKVPQQVSAFGTKLYGGLPADEIVKSIIAVGKVTSEMVQGLDPLKLSQITETLFNYSPALAIQFMEARAKFAVPEVKEVEKPEVSLAKPEMTIDEAKKMLIEKGIKEEHLTPEFLEKFIKKPEIQELPPSKKEDLTKGLEPELPEFKEEIEREPTAEELRIIEMERQIPENLKKPVPPELKADYLKIIGKEVKLAKDKMKLDEDIRKDITPSPEILVKYPNLIKELSKPEFTKIEIPKVEIPESLKKPVPPELKDEYLKIIQKEVKLAIDKLKIIKDIKENKPISEGILGKYPELTEKLAKLSEIKPSEIKVRPAEELPEGQKLVPSNQLKNDYLKIIGKDIKYTPDRLELIKDVRQDLPISEGLQTKYPDLMKKIPEAKFTKIEVKLAEELPEGVKPIPTTEKPAGVEEGQIVAKRPPTAEKILGIEKAPLIVRREDILLRQRIRDEARGAREGRQITKEELIAKFKNSQENIKNIKNDLIKYIDENLPTEAKGKFINPLTMENLTRKKAASIFTRVDQLKEDIEKKSLVSDIKKLAIPKGSLAVDYQKVITTFTKDIDFVKPTQKTLNKLKGLQNYIQKNGIPLNIQAKYLDNLKRLTKKPIREFSKDDLTELKDTLTQLQKLGKLKQYLKYKYHERERKVALNKLLNSTKNIDPKVSGKHTKSDIYKIGTKEVYMDTLHTPRVADMIDGFKGYKGENARYIKQLGIKETEAKETTRAIVNSALEEIQNLGIKELTEDQQLRMMINIRYREGAFDQVKTLMEKNNLKEIPNVTDQENKIIEIIKKYTNQYTDDIVAVFEEIENTPFNKLKEYILPIKYEKEFNLIPSQVIEQGRFRTTQTFKGFTFERQKGVEKTPRTDILAIFEEAINEQQWYLKMQPELENIKYLVKSKEYIARGGQMAANWWKDELDIVARRGWSATARSSPILRQTRINLNQAILGYKISSILMQPFAVFDAMAYAQSRYGTMATLRVLKEFSKAWIIPKYAKNIIAKSPALQQRQAGELAIEETLKKVGKTKGLVNSFIRGSMALLQKGDIITAAGVQKGMENILVKNGTPYVKEESEFLMNLVSGSNEIVYRPHILAKGEGARTWFTFQTFFLNRWGILIHDLIQSGVLRGGGEAGWKRLWIMLSSLIGLGIFIAGSIAEEEARKAIYEKTTGKELPDESTLKTAVMFIPEQIPYFGNLIEAADRGGDANPPVIRTAENFFSGGVSVIKGKTTETKIKGTLRMTEAGITLWVGVPGTAQAFDLLENIFIEKKEKEKGKFPMKVKVPQGSKSIKSKFPMKVKVPKK